MRLSSAKPKSLWADVTRRGDVNPEPEFQILGYDDLFVADDLPGAAGLQDSRHKIYYDIKAEERRDDIVQQNELIAMRRQPAQFSGDGRRLKRLAPQDVTPLHSSTVIASASAAACNAPDLEGHFDGVEEDEDEQDRVPEAAEAGGWVQAPAAAETAEAAAAVHETRHERTLCMLISLVAEARAPIAVGCVMEYIQEALGAPPHLGFASTSSGNHSPRSRARM